MTTLVKPITKNVSQANYKKRKSLTYLKAYFESEYH